MQVRLLYNVETLRVHEENIVDTHTHHVQLLVVETSSEWSKHLSMNVHDNDDEDDCVCV